jgi:hypothetical protein
MRGDPVKPIHGNDHYRELGQEAIHAIKLEEAAVVVLREQDLSPADRAVLERAVFIARHLQKAPKLDSPDPKPRKK